MSSLLGPVLALPQLETAVILLVGVEGIDKNKLAAAMVNSLAHFTIHVRLASNLSSNTKSELQQHPRIDFICFMADIERKESLENIMTSMSHVDVEYFLGRSCIVVLNSGYNQKQKGFEIEAIIELSDVYDTPVIYGNLKTEDSILNLSRQILHLAEIGAGFKRHMPPSLLGACCSYQMRFPPAFGDSSE